MLPLINKIVAKKYPLFLASASPRRKSILEELGIEVAVSPFRGVEPTMKKFSMKKLKEISTLKTGIESPEKALIIACDTIVVYNGIALGKPLNKQECQSVLRKLSGKTHKVVSAMTLKVIDYDKTFCFTSAQSTAVTFNHLDDELIKWYLDTNEWTDKAGGYAIQGKGRVLVKGIRGCYYNVVGLPLRTLQKLLCKVERSI